MINIDNLVRNNVRKLKPYSSARDEYKDKEGIFLDANENPFGELNRYPDPYQFDLKQKLSELKSVNATNIFIGNGSDEVIDLAFRIFCNPGTDKVLTFSPTYGMYDVSAAINDVDLIKVPLNKEFQIDLDNTIPYLSDDFLKLIFICSPNNPTGNLMNRKDIEYILSNFNGIVIVDEAYIEFASEESLSTLIEKYNNLVVSQTFSKARGLAAARVGIAYSSETIIEFYNKVKPPYNVSRINQEAALKALNDKSNYENRLATILSEKKRLINELETIPTVQKIYPSDSNFVLVKVEDANKTYAELVKSKIVTRNRTGLVKNCLRISVGTAEENNELINELRKR